MPDSEPKREFARRLNELCEEKGLPEYGRQSQLARLFGVTQKATRKWLLGEGLPELEMVVRVAEWGDVNVNWLLQGSGPKRGTKIDTEALVAHDILSTGTPEMRREFLDFIKFKVQTANEAMFPRDQRERTLKMIDDYKRLEEYKRAARRKP